MCRIARYTATYIKYFNLFITFLLLGSVSAFSQLRADFTVDKTGGCSPLMVAFSNTTSGASGTATYTWDFGNGNQSASTNPGAVFTDEKTYTVTLTVRDGSQTSTKSQQITVYKKPVADFTLSKTKDCLPAPITFTSTSTTSDGSITGYYWDFGDGVTQQGFSASQLHIYNVEQVATVSLTVTNTYGCNSTVQKKDVVKIIPHLSSNFTADKRILCLETDPVQFTNSSAGPGTLSYIWDFGDGNTSTQKNPNYSFNKKGIYTVKLTVNSTEGCTAINTQTNLLNVASYSSDFTVPALICKNNPATFTSQSSPIPTYTVWEVDNTVVNYYYNFHNQSFATAGTHAVKLTNTFENCVQSVTRQIKVEEIPDLKGFVTNINGVCGAPVAVNFRDTTPTAVKWEWDYIYDYYSPTVDATTKVASYTYTTDGIFNVLLRVYNAEGCASTAIKTIQTIKPYVTISAINTTSPNGVMSCGPNTVTFAANTSEEIVGFNWRFGDGGTSTDKEPVYTYNLPGTYQVALDYTTKNGCKGTAFFNSITIYKKPAISFNASATEVCGNNPVVFTAGPITADAVYWQWDFGDNSGIYSNVGSVAHSYFAEGTYTVKLRVGNYGCDTLITRENIVTVKPPFARLTGTSNTCDGTRGDVTLFQASVGANSLTWDFGDGTPTVTTAGDLAQLLHTYTRSGAYAATITATNGTCTQKSSINVQVLLKQKPVLSSPDPDICVDQPLTIKVAGYERNPRVLDNYTNHFGVQFQYSDNSMFLGYLTIPNYNWANQLDGNLNQVDRNKNSIRVITTSTYFGCTDTSNYITYKINGALAGFEVTKENVCFTDAVVLRDTSKSLTSNIKTWEWNFGDGKYETKTQGGSISHTYSDPGFYYVQLKVTDNSGCTSSTAFYTQGVTVNGPKAFFTVSGNNVPLSSTVYFYNNTNNHNSFNTQYEWTINGQFFSNTYGPFETFDVPGTYVVKLKATNPNTQCSSEYSQTIIVNNFNSAFRFNTNTITQSGCPPVVANFQNTSINYTYVEWDFGDGVKVGNVNYPSHVYEKPGKYIVKLSVYGPNGLKGEYIDSVIVNKPTGTVKADILEGCIGLTSTLTAESDHTGAHLWDFGDGNIGQTTDTFVKHTYRVPGTYSPVMLLRDASGCLTAVPSADKIKIRPDPVVNISPSQAQVCKGATVNLVATGGATYNWSPSIGLSNTTIATPIASPAITTAYTVEVADDIGCSSKGTITVAVVQPVTVQLNGNEAVCEGTPVQLNASGAELYTWIKTTTGLSNTQIPNPVANAPTTATYTVVGSDAFKCFTDTAEVNIKVFPLPTVNAGIDVEVLAGTPVQMSPVYSNDVTKWSWTPPDYLSCTNCAAPVSTPLSNTNYVLTVTNADGCTATDTMSIKMFCNESKVAIPNAFSPNGDRHNDVFMVKGIAIIKHMTIFNRWGQKVFERHNFIASDRSNCWNGTLKGYPADIGTYVYFIEMECPGGGAFSRKGTVTLVR